MHLQTLDKIIVIKIFICCLAAAPRGTSVAQNSGAKGVIWSFLLSKFQEYLCDMEGDSIIWKV